MSKELFESIRPHIQRMIDAHIQDNQTTDDGEQPPVVENVVSASLFQDNVTGKWHRVFLWDGVLYMELRETKESGSDDPPPIVNPPDNWIDPPLADTPDIGDILPLPDGI